MQHKQLKLNASFAIIIEASYANLKVKAGCTWFVSCGSQKSSLNNALLKMQSRNLKAHITKRGSIRHAVCAKIVVEATVYLVTIRLVRR